MFKRFAFYLFLLVATAVNAQTQIFLPLPVAAFDAHAPMAVGASPISINAAGIFAMAKSTEAVLSLANIAPIAVVHDRVEIHPSGNRTWIGYLRDFGTNYRVIITTGADGSSGRVTLPGKEYWVTSQAGQTWLLDPEAGGLIAALSLVDDGIIPSAHAIKIAHAKAAATQPTAIGEIAPSPQSVVDVMVVYTPSLATQLGSGLQARLDQLVAISNQAYIDSEVAITLRLVYSAQVAYSDSTDNDQALYELSGTNGATIPAGLAIVATLRNTYGADLVVLMRAYNASAQQSCGVGWIGGHGAGTLAGWDDYGYAVVSNGSDGGSFCHDLTFAHEIGHNMGNMHDHRTNPNDSTGVFTYSFGHGIDNSFVTVMGYPSSYVSAPRVGKFSNPSVSCNGQACGVSGIGSTSANNALSMNNIRAQVAAYRATAKVDQTITFGNAPTVAVGGTGPVSASTSSGLVVSFSVAPNSSGVCTLSGSTGPSVTVTGVAAGTCTIAANQGGNTNYAAATQVTQNITVSTGTQSIGAISLSPSTLKVAGTLVASATATSGLAVTFSSTTPTICSVTGNTVTGLLAGTCTIAANQAGNATFAAAPQVTQSFPVNKASQSIGTISFSPATISIGGTSTASATASSGLTVSFSSTTPSVCTVSGSRISGVVAGTCTIAANQAGNATYAAAPQVTQSFTVSKASQSIGTISFSPATLAIGGTSTVIATASSGLTVSFSSSTPSVCTVSGSIVTGLAVGACTVAANQAGNADYFAANSVMQNINVNQADVFPANCQMPGGWAVPSGANAGWNVATDRAYEGTCSLRSGLITHGQKAEISVSGIYYYSGRVSFARKVSSESGYDKLQFFIDGILQDSWSGEPDWALASFPLSAGSHTLLWRYSKDSSVSSGSDTAWIDSYSFDLIAPTVTQQPANQTVTAGQTVSFTAAASGTQPITVQWKRSPYTFGAWSDIPGATSLTFSFVASLADNGSWYVPVFTNLAGETYGTGANLTVNQITAPAVSLNPTSLTFDFQNMGTTSAPQYSTLTNTGNATLSIASIVTTGDFSVSNNCGSSLAAGDSCNLGVTFSPTTTLGRIGAGKVNSNATGSPHSVILSGTGVASGAPICTLSAAPATVRKNGPSTLTASCSPVATSFTWTGGTCAGKTASTCTVTPGVTTHYSVTGANSFGNSTAALAIITVKSADLTPILMLLLN